ncbi:MAG: polyprenyl diphosphate synthase [Porticoccaceae bacterium]
MMVSRADDDDSEGHPLHHLAVIMDGNNRWARQRGLGGVAGHRAGVEQVRGILDACQSHDIQVLTLFAFSSENWQRPAAEVGGLMSLFAGYLEREIKELRERRVRLRIIGEKSQFSRHLQKLIAHAENTTADGEFTLALAVDYGGRWDIVQAARQLARQVAAGKLAPEQISETLFEQNLCLGDLPMPDLCIRTAGERRISNFLLWQLAYTELYFADCYWPDFDRQALDLAVRDYYQRQRRFGLTGDQLRAMRRVGA